MPWCLAEEGGREKERDATHAFQRAGDSSTRCTSLTRFTRSATTQERDREMLHTCFPTAGDSSTRFTRFTCSATTLLVSELANLRTRFTRFTLRSQDTLSEISRQRQSFFFSLKTIIDLHASTALAIDRFSRIKFVLPRPFIRKLNSCVPACVFRSVSLSQGQASMQRIAGTEILEWCAC